MAPKIALVHDWLNQIGGAENVLEEMVSLFPDTSVHTSMYDAERMPAAYRAWDIHSTFMQHLPGISTHHQRYMPLYPIAFQQTDLSHYDVVLSNKSGFCHGIRTDNGKGQRATHICYCLTPTRFLWLYEQYREREQISFGLNAMLQPLLALLRRWDWAAAQRVDHFIAISSEIQQRIKNIYGRESVVIHPPVDTDYFRPEPSLKVGDYYLIVSRLIPYKRIDLAVDAFNQLPEQKLLIVGDGRDRIELEAKAASNITFLGRQSREQVLSLLRGCRAFLFPGLEDFGIAPVEAMSAGRPVIAFAGGGALDTVVPNISGALFQEQSVESLRQAVEVFQWQSYDSTACREQAENFSVSCFREKLITFVESV